MSPTEFDLRSALRDGEGDGVDPGRIVHLARTQRAQRRSRVLATAAAVVVAAGLATGGAFLARSSGNGGSGGSSADYAAGTTGGAQSLDGRNPAVAAPGAGSASSSRASSAGSTPSSAGSSAVAFCPASFPLVSLPGGGSPGQFGSAGPMFAKTPVSLLVCGYGEPGAEGTPAELRLDGTDAASLADSLEHAVTERTYLPCPLAREPKQSRLAIIGIAADGTVLRTVTATLVESVCNVVATNGTAIRYNWHPPANLSNALLNLTTRIPGAITTGPPVSGAISKSPVR